MEDPTLRRLTKKIFPYLWVRHKLMSSIPSTGIFPFSEMTVFSQEIGNTVLTYLHVYRPTLSNYLEKHIPSMPQSKMQFWTHVAFLCLQVRLSDDNVFDYFLTTFAMTAEVALQCHMNGFDDVLSLASTFFCAFFENELYEGFHQDGGWLGLQRYIEDTSCTELYELVDSYVEKLCSPCDHLPILITLQHEKFAAERREKLVSLLSFKIGEIEREDQTSKLVAGILNWYFMENHRISEVKPGILKRTGNLRHKRNKPNESVNEKGPNESLEADEALDDADNKISGSTKHLSLHEEAQSSEFISHISEKRCSNEAQTPDVEESTNQLCANNVPSSKTKFSSSSSSLRKLRNFYESLSATSERKTENLKCFKSDDGPESSASKYLANGREKFKHFERNTISASSSSENEGISPKSKNVTPGNEMDSTGPFHVDALSEFKKSFHELGFNCLCVENSSQFDEKSASFPNYAEVMEKCRYFQDKYSSVQFAILIPNNYFEDATSQAPETVKPDETHSEINYSEQQLSSSIKDSESCNISPQISDSEAEKTRSATTVNENESMEGTSISEQNKSSETETPSRFEVTPVDESESTSGTSVLGENQPDGNKTVSGFQATKNNENESLEGTSVSEQNRSSETETPSRFEVTPVDESESTSGTSVLGENQPDGNKTVSGFQDTTNNESESAETTETSSSTDTKVDEKQSNEGTCVLGRNWTDGSTEMSRFTVTKVDESNLRDVTIKNTTNDAAATGFSANNVGDNQLMSRPGTSLGESCSANTTQVSRFTVTRVDESNASCSLSSEISGDPRSGINANARSERRVSFAEHPSISYYNTYSSDESANSITSREILNQRDSLPPINSEQNTNQNAGQHANQEPTLDSTAPRNPLVTERRNFFQRLSSGDGQSSSSDTSSGSGFFGRIFGRI